MSPSRKCCGLMIWCDVNPKRLVCEKGSGLEWPTVLSHLLCSVLMCTRERERKRERELMVEKEREREKDDCVERERDGAKEKRGKNAPIKSFASIWGRMTKKRKIY